MAERAAEGGDGVEAEAEAEADPGFRDPCMVIWDVQSCPLFRGLDAQDILPRIRRRLSWWGYSGLVQMLAIGSYRSCDRYKLSSTGILISFISGGENTVSHAMLSWIENNRAPANILLIAGDRCYSATVKSLRQRNYNALQRQQECTCPGRENHCSYCWSWSELFDGERPQGNLKCSGDDDGPSLLGDDLDVVVSSLVISPCCEG